jgi:hypothetical protein
MDGIRWLGEVHRWTKYKLMSLFHACLTQLPYFFIERSYRPGHHAVRPIRKTWLGFGLCNALWGVAFLLNLVIGIQHPKTSIF